MKADFEYVRRYYGVPAKRGGRVRIWTGEEGTIVFARRARLHVRLDDDRDVTRYFHPAWGITYLETGVVT